MIKENNMAQAIKELSLQVPEHLIPTIATRVHMLGIEIYKKAGTSILSVIWPKGNGERHAKEEITNAIIDAVTEVEREAIEKVTRGKSTALLTSYIVDQPISEDLTGRQIRDFTKVYGQHKFYITKDKIFITRSNLKGIELTGNDMIESDIPFWEEVTIKMFKDASDHLKMEKQVVPNKSDKKGGSTGSGDIDSK